MGVWQVDQQLVDLKIHCMSHGIRVSAAATAALTMDGAPLTVHEYATTGGITFRIADLYVNAPFDDWYCARSKAQLDIDSIGSTVISYLGRQWPCDVLPLPGYLDAVNSLGARVTDTTMSHCDRIRVSPISGCTLDCKFCDLPALRYTRHRVEEILASIAVAEADTNLPAQHLLISGGSPGPAHFDWFDEALVGIIRGTNLATDVMMSPRQGSIDHVQAYVDAGARGFSLNLEVFGERAAAIMPRKHARSTPYFEETVAAAVAALGHGTGAVRSIVIVGLEDLATTLAAVEFIASLGVDPVLSPFRPAQNTALQSWEPPTSDFLHEVLDKSRTIAQKHGVQLGPRCIPCQHNTLTVPDGPDYGYWETWRRQ